MGEQQLINFLPSIFAGLIFMGFLPAAKLLYYFTSDAVSLIHFSELTSFEFLDMFVDFVLAFK